MHNGTVNLIMFTHLLLLLLVLPWGARSDTAADPALLTERFLRHVADLGLWSGTAACSSDAGVGSEMWQVGESRPARRRRRLCMRHAPLPQLRTPCTAAASQATRQAACG